jgi:hypothetical protein
MASLYMNSEVAWTVEEEDKEESKQGESNAEPQGMYVTTLSSAAPHIRTRHTGTGPERQLTKPLSLEESVTLEYKQCSAAQLAGIAAQGTEWLPGGIPDGTQSLRRAIQESFAGKKKVLSEAEVLGQTCMRCKKVGHTRVGCPDQVQEQWEDKTAADAWVRRLVDLPTVDIAVANAGLSMEECVERWKARGAEMNAGNPWAESKRREDSLRKCLGYHKAMGMSSVHIGWIGFGVPVKFAEECGTPKPLAFRNHKSAEEEGEFVDKEHATCVADGTYLEVPREMLRGICPLQVAKHPVSGKLRLCQDLGEWPRAECEVPDGVAA